MEILHCSQKCYRFMGWDPMSWCGVHGAAARLALAHSPVLPLIPTNQVVYRTFHTLVISPHKCSCQLNRVAFAPFEIPNYFSSTSLFSRVQLRSFLPSLWNSPNIAAPVDASLPQTCSSIFAFVQKESNVCSFKNNVLFPLVRLNPFPTETVFFFFFFCIFVHLHIVDEDKMFIIMCRIWVGNTL